MSDEKIRFYMQRIDIPGEEVYDLEQTFTGMKYVKAKGIDSIGEAVVCEEKYAEQSGVDVYVPSVPINKQTKIDMTFYFIGPNRTEIKDIFDDYIRTGIHKFWDTKRKKEFSFYVKDKIEVSEEKWCGSVPYLEVTYKLSNIDGKTKQHI